MSLEEIEWTESEGDTDDNLGLDALDGNSDDERAFTRQLSSAGAWGGSHSADSAAALGNRPGSGISGSWGVSGGSSAGAGSSGGSSTGPGSSGYGAAAVLGNAASSNRGPRRVRDEDLDPEVEEAYQCARGLYTQGNYDQALEVLEEAIRHEAGSKLLFNLLASIHEERQDMEKALLARIHVAALDKRDRDTWIDVGERSMQLGYWAQAAWSYQQVSRLDRDNWQWLRMRADLHFQLNQQTAALGLLQRIRARFFARLDHDAKTHVLLDIAGALKELGRADEALKIYMDIFSAATSPASSTDGTEVDLDWQNLNILCELLTDQKQYARLVIILKTGARHINHRGKETFWQQFSEETDAEFDERRVELVARMSSEGSAGGSAGSASSSGSATNSGNTEDSRLSERARAERSIEQDEEAYDMPIDIRIWLLQARLRLVPAHLLLQARNTVLLEAHPAVRDALVHLERLRQCQPVQTYADLYRKGALAFFEARLYLQSRELYVALTDIEHESEAEYLDMTVQVAKCEMELHNVARAEQLYRYVLERDPASQEALVAMGEIYAATDRAEESRRALRKLEEVRAKGQVQPGLSQTSSQAVSQQSQAISQQSQGISHRPHTSDALRAADLHASESDDEPAVSGNIYVETRRSRSLKARPNRAERAEMERGVQLRADAAFSGLAQHQSGLDAHNAVAAREWLRYADELVDMFAAHRKFFPVDKQKDYFEGSSNASVDQRMARLRLAQLDAITPAEQDEQEEERGEREGEEDAMDLGSDLDEIVVDDALLDASFPDKTTTGSAGGATGGSTSAVAAGDGSGAADADAGGSAGASLPDETFVWRGQPLSMWFWVLMRSSLTHAEYGGVAGSERAQQVVAIAQSANVFSRTPARVQTAQFVALACADLSGEPAVLGDLLRQVQMQHQFDPISFQLYMAMLGGPKKRAGEATSIYGAGNNQKFFLRQIKALDALVHKAEKAEKTVKAGIDEKASDAEKAGNVEKAGNADESEDSDEPDEPDEVAEPVRPRGRSKREKGQAPDQVDPHLLMLYVYIMLLGPSYWTALTYLIRVRESLPRHPLVLLVYGVVQMHRMSQRTSLNRHTQLLEGLSFMQDYADERGSSPEQRQEVAYNFGRFFHGVGLLSLAIPHYEQALALADEVGPRDDLSREAAYNLHLIYAESDNMELSAEIVDKYLVI